MVVLAMALMAATGQVAAAGPSSIDRITWSDSYAYDDCGFTVEVAEAGESLVRLRPGKHGDATPYYFENFNWRSVSTNPVNGKWFVEEGIGLYRDLRISNVEGTVYTFVDQLTGRSYTLTDMDGNHVVADHGHLLTTFQLDTKGDADLSNDEFIEGSFEVLDDNGAHPSINGDAKGCELVG